MAGILDILDAPKDSLFGMLNMPASQGFGDVPKDKDAGEKSLWEKLQAETEKQNADADRRNAAGLAASQIPSLAPVAGASLPAIDPQLAAKMALGQAPATPFGSLAPTAPQQPAAAAPQTPIPLPQPRPVIPPPAAPSQALPPPVANAQASVPIDQTTAPQLPVKAEPQAAPSPSFGDQVGGMFSKAKNYVDTHQATLLALAGGLAGAPSLGQGLGRGFTQAAAALPIDQKTQQLALQQGGGKATYDALVAAGAPKQQAIVAAYNPESSVSKALIQSYITDRKSEIKTVKDALGNERLVSVNPYDNTSKPIETGGGAAASIPSTAEPNYDPVTKRDEAFLKSLDPTTAAAVKDIADGNMAGSGRNLQKLMPYVARYEQGFSNGTYTARNKFNTELGSQSASTVGGQKVLMGTALGHLGEAADSAVALNNTNGLGSADIGHIANATKNRTTENSAIANGHNDRVAKFSGEVGKLYSGSSGGGVHEREESRGRLGSNLTSAELASGLESNRDLILSKQQALEQHAVDLFGPEGAKKYDFIGPEGRKSLEKIETAIAKLRGTAPAQVSPAAPLPSGWSVKVH